MDRSNITKCCKCGLDLIFEDEIHHKCWSGTPEKVIIDYKSDFVSIHDGIRWYRFNLKKLPSTKCQDLTGRKGDGKLKGPTQQTSQS